LASAETAKPDISKDAGEGSLALAGRASLGRPFWRLWWATGISAGGDGLVAVALPLLAFSLAPTDPLAIAGVTATNRAFVAIAALPAGVITDRVDRRSVMIASNLVAGATMLALVAVWALGRPDLVMVYVAASVLAVCDVTYMLSMQASFPDVVSSPDQLATANGRLTAVAGAGAQFLGPGFGGVLFSLAQRLPFAADGASFLASAWLVSRSLPRRAVRRRHRAAQRARELADRSAASGPASGEDCQGRHPDQTGWWADLRSGLRTFRRQRALKLLAAMIGSLAFTQSMVIAILVLYGRDVLTLSNATYGVFIASASLFGIAGAFASGSIERRFGTSRVIIGGSILATVSYLGLAFTREVVLAVFVFGLQEIGLAVANVASVTVRQRLVPRGVYGRVGSVHSLTLAGAAPLGAIAGGVIASMWGVPRTMFVAGALQVAVLAVMAPPLARALASAARPVPETACS
jgi:MFS family permease